MQPSRTPPPLDRMVQALNAHDLDAMVACFAHDYVNRTPAHPRRGFVGSGQVRTNWSQIFTAVPDVRAGLTRVAVAEQTVWSEWEISGTRADETAFLMRGVVIFEIPADIITAATFYLEPVEDRSGGPNQAVQRVIARPAPRRPHDPHRR